MIEESKLSADGLEVVGWAQRYICPDEGPSVWQQADARTAEILRDRKDYELQPLCRLTDAQRLLSQRDGDVDKWKALAESAQKVAGIAQRGHARMARIYEDGLSQLRDELAQRDAEIERLRGHIRTDNTETLANALAEIERLGNENARIADEQARNLDYKALYREACAKIAALESQQAASVGGEYFSDNEIHQFAFEVGGTNGGEYRLTADELDEVIAKARPALSLAGGGVVLPERNPLSLKGEYRASNYYADGWNDALDEVARLNAKPSDEA